MKLEIITHEFPINRKEPELCGSVKQAEIYTLIGGKTVLFNFRFKTKDGKVTVLEN